MIALLAAVLAASFLGSAHCAGMCGCFALLAARDGGARSGPGAIARQVAAYHGARGAAYGILGAIAGGLGAALDLGGGLVGWQRAAAVLAGASLVAIGGVSLLRLFGMRVRVPRIGTGGGARWRRFATAGHRFAARFRGARRAAWIGGLSALLPCGWLYAFLVTAAGTGSILGGALVMLAFFLGSVPVLALIGCGGASLGRVGSGSAAGPRSGSAGGPKRWVRPVRLAASLVVIAVGVGFATARASLPLERLAPEPASEGADLDAEVSRVESLDTDSMPCCHGE